MSVNNGLAQQKPASFSFLAAASAGVLYFAIIFAFGVGTGVLTQFVLIPALGLVVALLAELAATLVLSWIVCAAIVRQMAVPATLGPRITMGVSGLVLQLAAALFVSTWLPHTSAGAGAASYLIFDTMLGLGPQIAFAAIPAIQLLRPRAPVAPLLRPAVPAPVHVPVGVASAAGVHALAAIRRRQRTMSVALLAVRTLSKAAVRSNRVPDFRELKALVDYVDRFSEGLHQPAEDRIVLRQLEARAPALARPIARARRDHAASKGYIARLRHALSHWQNGNAEGGASALLVADDYLRFNRLHVRLEERDLWPAALSFLSDADWREIDLSLDAVEDPLAASRDRATCARIIRELADGPAS